MRRGKGHGGGNGQVERKEYGKSEWVGKEGLERGQGKGQRIR